MPGAEALDSREAKETSPIVDPGQAEMTRDADRVGQSRGNHERIAELEAALANVTRLLTKVDDAQVASELVAERKAMREELEALRRPDNVVALARPSGRPR
jgi:hypothetical protein